MTMLVGDVGGVVGWWDYSARVAGSAKGNLDWRCVESPTWGFMSSIQPIAIS